MAEETQTDLRGQAFRAKRLVAEQKARQFVRQAYVGTSGLKWWPYAVPHSQRIAQRRTAALTK